MMSKSALIRPARCLALVLTIFVVLFTAQAQEQTQYDKGTPPQHAAGVSSIGSYASADIGTVNLSNGALNLKLPLVNVGGRGFWVPLTLNYSSKVWSASSGTDVDSSNGETARQGSVVYAAYAEGDSGIDYYNRIAPGWTIGAQPLLRTNYTGINQVPGSCSYYYKLTTLTLVLPDKGEIQLRDDVTNGAPLPVPNGQGCGYRDGFRGARWHATDGSGTIFISDDSNGVVNGVLNGTAITADGMRYRFESISVTVPLSEGIGLARCTLITDRNGNKVQITYPSSSEVRYTDQLGRVTSVVFEGLQIVVTAPGYQGTPRTYKIKLGSMVDFYRSDQNPNQLPVINGDYDSELSPHGYMYPIPHITLFPNSWGEYTERIDTQEVVSELELPDGRSMHFKYNEYGEVAEVQMPTGGKVQYDYAAVNFLPAGNTFSWEKSSGLPIPTSVNNIDRALVAHRTYPDGSTQESNWSYTYGPQPVNGTNYACTTVQANSGAGTDASSRLLNQRHYFLAGGRYLASANPHKANGTGYSLWSTGVEWRTETLDAANTIISASEQDWSQRQALNWSSVSAYPQEQPENDNRVNEARQILDNGLMAKTTTLYDQYSNPTEVKEYDFDASLKRRTVTSYVDGSTFINGVDYTSDSVHLLRLPLSHIIYDGGGTQSAQTVFEYDNYGNDGNNAPLDDYGLVSGHDSVYGPGKVTRGNATRSGSWLHTPGVAGDSYLYAYLRYDTLGNIVSMKDGRGYVSTISYADDFGDGSNPGGGATGSQGATYALPTLMTSSAPNPGEQPHTARSQYDFSTGLLTGFKDRNGVVSQTLYDDPFNRPTVTRAALGTAMESHSRMYYAPATVLGITLANSDVLTTSDLAVMDDAQRRSWTQTDGFGRTLESWKRDPQGDVEVQTLYDNLGRQRQTSNPFRPSANESALYTTTGYDLAGRVSSVTTPDGAQVTTSYSGNHVTVTDQVGKQRQSTTDALGRLMQVIEAPNDPSYNYQTNYGYDALGNLRTVTQGMQTRTFTYDSLSRLASTSNPESGTISYTYDANGNLSQRTDARGIATNYAYDALNRAVSRIYSDSTPAVTYTYDTATNGKGRLTSVSSSVSTYNYGEYDAAGRLTRSSQATDSQTYTLSYGYNLAGDLTTETYPSGRVVTTNYDNAGRLSSVSGQKSGEANKTYVSQVSYAASGATTDLKLGNNLWEHTLFNSRSQPTEIGLGTAQDGVDRLKLNYSYGMTTNNGNIQSQTITVPGGTTLSQSYEYDQLNRLKVAQENSGTSWKQTFIYDKYGNRNFDPNNTTTNAIGSLLTIDQANNRFTAGQGSILYDNAGNLTRDFNGHTFEYDGENKQVAYDGGATVGGGASYFYDGDGRRVKKINGGSLDTTIFVYDASGQMVVEYSTASTSSNGNGTSYLTVDNLGTPRIITDSNGAVKARHDYLPFGEEIGYNPILNVRSTQQGYAGDNVRQKFTKYERDNETGLDYAQARYYSNTQARFTSPDPLLSSGKTLQPQSWNRYSYCLNNPLIIVDPSGLIWIYQDIGKDKRSWRWIDGSNVPKDWTAWKGASNVILANGDLLHLGRGGHFTLLHMPQFSEDSISQARVNSAAGAFDGLLPFGIARAIREGIGLSGGADTSSSEYNDARVVSFGALLLLPGGGASKVSEVALDTNALIPLLEGTSAEAAAVTNAIAGRTPLISITAAKEFLKGGGDINALRQFLQNTGGSIAPSASSSTIQSLLGIGVKSADARVIGSAIDRGIPLLTRDKSLLNKVPGIATPF